MAEAFKNWINPASIRAIGERIQSVQPAFQLDAFVSESSEGLDALELKARVAQVSRVLRSALPQAWEQALELLVRSLPAPLPDASEVTSGFAIWPVLHCVEVYGLDHPEASLDALREMTKRFSAEFAVRPFLDRHPQLTWDRIHTWIEDEDVHVRRLCSEGSRPRLPWGMRLRASIDDPSAGLAVLDRLVDDPELYVRRSVANHLNDISKDHPERAVEHARAWLESATEARAWVVRHALRSLVKQGHEGALEVLGYGAPSLSCEGLSVDPDPVEIGGSTKMATTLLPDADQDWIIDWIVWSPRADGSLSQRVVKGSIKSVRAGKVVRLTKKLSLKPVTTRVTRPGTWRLGVQVNGVLQREIAFEVVGEAR